MNAKTLRITLYLVAFGVFGAGAKIGAVGEATDNAYAIALGWTLMGAAVLTWLVYLVRLADRRWMFVRKNIQTLIWLGEIAASLIVIAASLIVIALLDAWRLIFISLFSFACVLGLYWLISNAVADGVRKGRL